MNIVNNIMDLFRAAPTPPANTPTANPAVNPAPTGSAQPGGLPGTKQTAQTDANGVVPNSNDPLSFLKGQEKIWDTVEVDPKVAAEKDIFANFDPAKVMQSAGQVDFTKVLKPEILQAAIAGGEDGMKALVSGLNTMVQNSYGRSALTTKALVQEALQKQQDQFMGMLPELIRKTSAMDSLQEDPVFADPAVQPLVGMLVERTMQKNPNTSQQDAEKIVREYFTGLSAALTASAVQRKTAPAAQKAATTKKSSDFSSFLPPEMRS